MATRKKAAVFVKQVERIEAKMNCNYHNIKTFVCVWQTKHMHREACACVTLCIAPLLLLSWSR
jgi:hypothetical protein